jgi:hypothetical protein
LVSLGFMNEAGIGYRALTSRRLLLGTGDGDALQNVIPTPIPDGALVFVQDEAAIYRLDKFSMVASAPPEIVATILGESEPGRWVRVTASGTSTAAMYEGTSADNTANSDATINFVLSDSALYAERLGTALWVFDPNACTSVYAGPRARWLVRVTISIAPADVLPGDSQIALGIAFNNDILGSDPTTTFTGGTQTEGYPDGQELPIIITTERMIDANPGDDVHPVFAIDGAADLQIRRLVMTITPAGAAAPEEP